MTRQSARSGIRSVLVTLAMVATGMTMTACTLGDDIPQPSDRPTSVRPSESTGPQTLVPMPTPGSPETTEPAEPTESPTTPPPTTPPSDGDSSDDNDDGQQDTATPVQMSCDEVLTVQQVYEFNPSYGDNPNYSPDSLASRAAAMGGVACSWLNQTSGFTLNVALARPTASTLAEIKSDAAGGTAVSSTGGDTYFSTRDNVGVSQTFVDGYWIVVTAPPLFEHAGDARGIVSDVVDNLP